ncbi:L-asparaginase 2 precursor [Vibrio ruber DSM 16370]|uniref:L-asparaginase 2 n=1 Tax=Vibrio ruber (strain DSM 16370 / JCM 11486 / BCRC 17186 / CECT 7878 / LMG 23124 / VR1) TaxID=1123498 RepID=A0A1R4LDF2_VIBR1|nr:asparaginase [Vibrio ruber]SJN54596.1 L-asparaginase 2 precursor [Vibrio ruber DSM 16370]
MKKRYLVSAIMLLTSMSSYADNLPHVTIYATGGTIAGSSASNVDSTDYKAGSLGVDKLIHAVPELKGFADVSGVQIANVGSPDIDKKTLLNMAKTINEDLAKDETHGVVVTHGTDTLEETAFFLDLTVNSKKPVVVVGAMRPATAISADGAMNLYDAVKLASVDEANGRGTMVAMNDRISPAYYVTKTNTHAVETFQAPEAGYLGGFISGQPYFYYKNTQPMEKPHFDISDIKELPKVDILYSYQDQDDSLIKAAIKNGAKGIVIAGTGDGSTPSWIQDAIKDAMKKGIPVVVASRVYTGYVSTHDNAIGSGFYNPQKSKVILELALAKGESVDEIRKYFAKL